MRRAYERNKRSYNLRSRTKQYDVGQDVYRRNFVQSSKIAYFNSKLAPVGVKARVLSRKGQLYYELEDINGANKGIYHAKDIWT